MNKTKKLLLVCGILMGAGLILTVIGFGLGGGISGMGIDSYGLHIYTFGDSSNTATTYVQKELSLDAFSSIDIDVAFANVNIEPSDHFGLSYKVADTYEIIYEVQDGCLTLKQKTPRTMSIPRVMLFGYFTGASSTLDNTVTIYLPKDTALRSLAASIDNGNMTVTDTQAENCRLSLDFGNLTVKDSTIGDFAVDSDSGSMFLTNISGSSFTADNSFGSIQGKNLTFTASTDITMDSGSFTVNNATLGTLHLDNSFGSVTGSSVSVESADMELDSGRVDLDDFDCSGVNISSSFGGVTLQLRRPLSEYAYDLSTDFGTIMLDGEKKGQSYRSESGTQPGNSIVIEGDSADITINN